MLEKIGEAIRGSLRKLISSIFIGDKEVEEFLISLRRNLLLGDVNKRIVDELIGRIRERIKKEVKGFNKSDIVKIVYEELVKICGESGRVEVKGKPFKILMVGLFGSGKTTTCAKLAKYFKKRGYRVALLGLDTVRPAAMEQLAQLARKVGVDAFIGEGDPISILDQYKEKLKEYDVVIVDSAGRNALDAEMKEELRRIEAELKPQETLLVMSGDIGQGALEHARGFSDAVKLSGVIITKLDGAAKGGGALAACKLAKVPIKFIGTGEHLDDFEEFDAKRFISRLLGLGDLETLLKKAEEVVKEEEARRMVEGEFDLLTFYEQLEALRKLGPLSKVVQMIPGIGMMGLPKELFQLQEEKLRKFRYIMDSMTLEELKHPEIIKGSRIDRIAKGAGVKREDVKELLDFYFKLKKLMQMLRGREMQKLLRRFGL